LSVQCDAIVFIKPNTQPADDLDSYSAQNQQISLRTTEFLPSSSASLVDKLKPTTEECYTDTHKLI